MAFNIIAETGKKLDFNEIHREIYVRDMLLEFIPMPGLGTRGGDAVGICIPFKNANERAWIQLKPVLKKLNSKFGCDIYDLHGGQKLGFFNIDSFKKNLLGE